MPGIDYYCNIPPSNVAHYGMVQYFYFATLFLNAAATSMSLLCAACMMPDKQPTTTQPNCRDQESTKLH